MHQAFRPAPEALQLHKATKVHEPADFALVDSVLLRLVQQGGRGRPVACRTPPVPAPLLWANSASPFAVFVSVSAAAAMLPFPVSVPMSISVRAVSVVTGASIFIPAVSAAVVIFAAALPAVLVCVRAVCCTGAGAIVGLLAFAEALSNQLCVKLLCSLFAVLQRQSSSSTELCA